MKEKQMKEKLSTIISSQRDNIVAALTIVIFYSVLQLFKITCPIKFVTGISCPGCGMTRAWLSLLLRFDIHKAFYYHPLFWIPPIGLAVILLKKKLKPSIYKIIIFSICAAFILVYIYRMLFLNDGVVICFKPGNNIIAKIFKLIQTNSGKLHL